MKSQQRHEMQTNILADKLGKTIESSESWAPWALAVVLGVTVVGGGYLIYQSRSSQNSAAAWTQYYLSSGSGDAETLSPIVSTYPGTTAALWAKQAIADSLLASGSADLLSDRQGAMTQLQEAADSYREIMDKTSDPLLMARAEFSLAQSLESMGKLDEAKELYLGMADRQASQMLIDEAKQRAEWLDSAAGKEFYTWFAAQEVKPADPLNLPANLGNIPGMPDLSFPPADAQVDPQEGSENPEPAADKPVTGEGVKLPPAGADTTPAATESDIKLPPPAGAETSATETPPAAEVPPVAETPELEIPTPEAPATAETPATETPATETPATEPASTETPATPAGSGDQ